MRDKPIYPWEFTSKEGGNFQTWKFGAVTEDQLAQRSGWTVKINGIRVHSLIFETAAAGLDNVARWDCVNGWTKTIYEAYEAWPWGHHGEPNQYNSRNEINLGPGRIISLKDVERWDASELIAKSKQQSQIKEDKTMTNSITMTQETYEALEQSIQKWEQVCMGDREIGTHDCALCKMFGRACHNETYGCCPVGESVTRLKCKDTPYDLWTSHHGSAPNHDLADRRIRCARCADIARRELKFLQDLRDNAIILQPEEYFYVGDMVMVDGGILCMITTSVEEGEGRGSHFARLNILSPTAHKGYRTGSSFPIKHGKVSKTKIQDAVGRKILRHSPEKF